MCVAACESVRVCICTCTRFTYGWSIAGDSPHTIAVCVNLKLLAVLFRWWKWVVKFSCCRPVQNISWYVTFLDDLSQSTFRFKKKSIRLLSSTVLGGWCTSLNQRTWTQTHTAAKYTPARAILNHSHAYMHNHRSNRLNRIGFEYVCVVTCHEYVHILKTYHQYLAAIKWITFWRRISKSL